MTIKVKKGTIHYNLSRDSYWSRFFLESPKNKVTKVLICASHEYLEDTLKIKNFNKEKLENWRDTLVKKWESKGNSVFNKKVHFDVCAVTNQGYKNGFIFLENETSTKT